MNYNVNESEIIENLRQGVTKLIYSKSESEFNGFDASKMRIDRHQHREMLFVVSGESFFMLNNKIFKGSPGSIFLIDHWENHLFQYTPDDNNLLHIWFHYNNNYLDASLFHIGVRGNIKALFKQVKYNPAIANLLLNRWNLLSQQEKPSEDEPLFLMKSILNLMLEEFILANYRPLSDSPTIQSPDIVAMICRHIERVNGNNCTMAQLETITGYSRFYLSHLFQAKMNKSIHQFIDEVRLNFTENAIRHGLKQKEIADLLGFANASSFWSWKQKHR